MGNMKSKKEYDQLIGKALRSARKRKRMSQDTLAQLLGIDRRTISKYETGDNPIDMSTFMQICDVMGLDAIQVLEDL